MKPFDEPGNYEYDFINFDNIYLIENYLWVDIVWRNINYLHFFQILVVICQYLVRVVLLRALRFPPKWLKIKREKKRQISK